MSYFYKHSNGTTQFKPDIVVDIAGGGHRYFQGPYCLYWWFEEGTHSEPIKDPHENITEEEN